MEYFRIVQTLFFLCLTLNATVRETTVTGAETEEPFPPAVFRVSVVGSAGSEQSEWEQTTVYPQLGHKGSIASVAFSPDGRQVLSGSHDGTIKLWDTATAREIRTFSGHSGIVYSVAFSPNGRLALSGSQDGTVKLWNVVTGSEIRTFSGHRGSITSVAFSQDGILALSGSRDRTVKLWDVATGREIRKFSRHRGSVNSIAFSPDGRAGTFRFQ